MNTIRLETHWDRDSRLRLVETPASRATDPESSHIAGELITASGARQRQIDQVARAVRAHPGCTRLELHALTGLDKAMLGRRLPDAVTAGAIVKGLQRTCSEGNCLSLTWWPAEPEMKAAA